MPGSTAASLSSAPLLEELRSTDERVNAGAWQQAYPRLWEAALSLLQGVLLTGAQHAQDREDIAAQALAQVVRGLIEGKLESFNQIASFDDLKGMTLHIVRARVTDFFRQRARRPEEVTDEVPELSSASFAPVDSSTAGSLTRDEFDRLIGELSPPMPEIFHAHYVLGQTAAEIAAGRGLSRNTVLSHLHRGKKALHQRLTALFSLRQNDAPGQPLPVAAAPLSAPRPATPSYPPSPR